MKLTKANIEKLYKTMSLSELAAHLGMAKSTLYYHMKKLGVQRRSKQEAQCKHLKSNPHQRSGKKHTSETVNKISQSARRYWDSSKGEEQKGKLRDLRRDEWTRRSKKQQAAILDRLKTAERPAPGELSRFGEKLVTFLSERETVKTGIQLTANHVSDIILDTRKVVIELLLPTSVYGDKSEQKTEARYGRLVEQLNDMGYRVVIIEDKSNVISIARCQRVYDQLLGFFESQENVTTIIS